MTIKSAPNFRRLRELVEDEAATVDDFKAIGAQAIAEVETLNEVFDVVVDFTEQQGEDIIAIARVIEGWDKRFEAFSQAMLAKLQA